MVAKFATLTALAALPLSFATELKARANTVPEFVLDNAPLVYLDANEEFFPSDIGSQVTHTQPDLNRTQISDAGKLSLSDLSSLNSKGKCSIDDFDDCPVYLTAKENITKSLPDWLYGVVPNKYGKTEGATSATVIVNDHGDGTVDAFYMFFFAFNKGLEVGGTVYDNHVGDWEHTMVRFKDEKPDTMYFSQHDGGKTYTFKATAKRGSRPLVYSSLGGHASYPVPGIHGRDYSVITINDTTSAGSLWDPLLDAYYYTFKPSSDDSKNGTFTPATCKYQTSTSQPTDWLYFLGRWGDLRLPDSNPAQNNLVGITYTWDTGPTGPLDKGLQRDGSCPQDDCETMSELPASSGSSIPQTVSRTASASAAPTTEGAGAGAPSSVFVSATINGGAAATSSNAAARTAVAGERSALLFGAFAVVLPALA